MKTYTGIVLKHFAPKKNTCALLDKTLGRINAIVMHDKLSVGTVLSYSLSQKRQWYILEAVEVLDMPFGFVGDDMLFLHYLLEMCYHFTIQDGGPDKLYDLLIFILKNRHFNTKQKIRILCIFMAFLDLYPEDALLSSAFLHALSQKPFDEVINTEIDVSIEKNISRWLYQCVRLQTSAQEFKTIHFLDEIR